MGAHNEATSTFEQCLDALDREDAEGELGGELGAELRAELREEWPTELLRAWAHVGIAQSFASRWLNTRDAMRHLRDAERRVAVLTSCEPRRGLLAAASACRGEIYLHKGDADRAIRALERAASLHEDGRTRATLPWRTSRSYERVSRPRRYCAHSQRAGSRSARGPGGGQTCRGPIIKGPELERRLRVWERYARRGSGAVQETTNGALSAS